MSKNVTIDISDFYDNDDFFEDLSDEDLIEECIDRKIIKKISLSTYIILDNKKQKEILIKLTNKEKRQYIAEFLGLNNGFDKKIVFEELENLYKYM